MAAALKPASRVARGLAAGMGAVLLAVVFALVFYPIAIMVGRGIFPGGSFDPQLWVTTLSDPALHIAVRNTLILAVATTVLSVPLGVFFAWLIERTDARWGALSRLLPVIPLLLPPVAMAIGWLFLADPRAGFLAHAVARAAAVIGLQVDLQSLSIQSWPGLIFHLSACAPSRIRRSSGGSSSRGGP